MVAITLAGLAVSCVSTKQETPASVAPNPPNPVWPPPPDEPRIVYVKSISGPVDIGASISVWTRMARWVAGETGESQSPKTIWRRARRNGQPLRITDTGANTVCYCDFAHKQWRRWKAVGKIQFQLPVAVARKNGIFYVADSQLGKVLAFRDNGRLVFQITAPLKRAYRPGHRRRFAGRRRFSSALHFYLRFAGQSPV